jgi:hypothetical protein
MLRMRSPTSLTGPRVHPGFDTRLSFFVSCAALLAGLLGLAVGGCSRSTTVSYRLVLNEAMARNDTFPLVDVNGLHLDWIEIYNPGPNSVPLSGYSLSDRADRPLEYVFPASDTIGSGEYRVVFMISDSDIAEFEAGDGATPPRRFQRTPFHATFGLSQSSESIYLFARNGESIVDRIEIRNLASDISVGRFPDGDARGFGPIYAPTPGSSNSPLGFEPVRWSRHPRAVPPLADGRIPVTFTVQQDAGAMVALPTVILEVVDLDGGCDLTVDTGYVEIPLAEPAVVEQEIETPCSDVGGEVDPDDGCRRDAFGAVVPLSVRTVEYTGFLPSRPPEECGTTVIYRVTVDDGVAELRSLPVCYTYCAATPTLVVNEYLARNKTTIFFVCETCDDIECSTCVDDPACTECRTVEGLGPRQVISPDWIEIYNYGDSELDISSYGLRGRIEDGGEVGSLFTWQFGRDTTIDGQPDPHMTRIGPGEHRLIIADADGGDVRRVFRRVSANAAGRFEADMTRRYYSTSFRLNPDRRTGPDEFLLVADSGAVIDRVVLDFRRYIEENGLVVDENFLTDQSTGRFPELDSEIPPEATGADRYPPDALQPGIVTDCPTPESGNLIVCDLPPVFFVETSVFPRCPRAGEGATVRTRLAVDLDADPDFDVRVLWRVRGGASGSLDRTNGVVVTPSPSSAIAPPGTTLWEISATLPGFDAGTIVEYEYFARAVLGTDADPRPLEASLDEATARSAGNHGVSFVFAVEPEQETQRARISEILPRNRGVSIAGFPSSDPPDFVEIEWVGAASGSSALDLSGYFLASELGSEAEGVPIREPRRFAFPDGTELLAGERILVAIGVPTGAIPSGVFATAALDIDCEGGTLYLIGPDDAGNCITDQLTWWGSSPPSCVIDEFGESAADDLAVGRGCDGEVTTLTVPTPLEPNTLPPLLIGVSHADFLSGAPNPCPNPGEFIRLGAEFLVDSSLPVESAVRSAVIEFEDGTTVTARVLRGGALPNTYPDLFEVPQPCEGNRPSGACYRRIGFVEPLRVPNLPVARFRLRVEDSCGGVLEPCPPGEFCFSIGTSAASPPPIAINEVVRLSTLPGAADGRRHWLELYNYSDAVVDLSGMSLSNDPTFPRMAVLPEGTTIAPRSALLVVTDGRSLVIDEAPEHVVVDLPWAQIFVGEDRRCRLKGELLLIDRIDRGTCLIDRFPFEFSNDVPDPVICGRPGDPGFLPDCTTCDGRALGRVPDGGGAIAVLDEASPGLPNESGPPGAEFLRGDANRTSTIGIEDAVRILQVLFLGFGTPSCPDALDVDDSGVIAVSDAIYLLTFLFSAGNPPPPPFPAIGADPTLDELGCENG